MDDDFDFPPDHTADDFTIEPENIELQQLAQTSIDRLPPTRILGDGAVSIGSLLRHAVNASRQHGPSQQVVHLQPSAPAVPPGTTVIAQPVTAAPEPAPEDGRPDISTMPPLVNWEMPQNRRPEWTDDDLARFYDALSQFGTDFGAIAVLFPQATDADVKRLYHRERRARPEEVAYALQNRKPIDMEKFETALSATRPGRETTAPLAPEVEEALRLATANMGGGESDAGESDTVGGAPLSPSPSTEVETRAAEQEPTLLQLARQQTTPDNVIDDNFDFSDAEEPAQAEVPLWRLAGLDSYNGAGASSSEAEAEAGRKRKRDRANASKSRKAADGAEASEPPQKRQRTKQQEVLPPPPQPQGQPIPELSAAPADFMPVMGGELDADEFDMGDDSDWL